MNREEINERYEELVERITIPYQFKINELEQENEELRQEKYKLILDSNGLINANGLLQQENKELHNKIDKAIEYIKHYESIKGYYEYVENGYDEYNYEEDLQEELLEILKDSDVDENR